MFASMFKFCAPANVPALWLINFEKYTKMMYSFCVKQN